MNSYRKFPRRPLPALCSTEISVPLISLYLCCDELWQGTRCPVLGYFFSSVTLCVLVSSHGLLATLEKKEKEKKILLTAWPHRRNKTRLWSRCRCRGVPSKPLAMARHLLPSLRWGKSLATDPDLSGPGETLGTGARHFEHLSRPCPSYTRVFVCVCVCLITQAPIWRLFIAGLAPEEWPSWLFIDELPSFIVNFSFYSINPLPVDRLDTSHFFFKDGAHIKKWRNFRNEQWVVMWNDTSKA